MALLSTPVSRSLDRKLLVLGYEVPDLLAIFLTLAVLNLIFGRSGHTLILVWLPAMLLALGIRLSKKGKTERHLIYLLRYLLTPGIYSAFQESKKFKPWKGTSK